MVGSSLAGTNSNTEHLPCVAMIVMTMAIERGNFLCGT